MSLVAPTLKNRISSLDVLRGIAILGILLANIFAFGWASVGEMSGFAEPIPNTNYWVEGLRVAFVTGKFRGLFCLLFGAGVYLQYSKLKSAGKWPGGYVRRNLLLMGIGAIHLFLIWYGDILFMYSLAAFVVMWMAGLEDRWIIGGAAALFGVTMLCGLGMLGATMAGFGGESGGMEMLSPARETRIFSEGTYLEQFQFRATIGAFSLGMFPIIFPEIGCLFLVGLYMARKGIFARPSAHSQEVKWLAIIGACGLLLNLGMGAMIGALNDDSYSTIVEMGLNVPLAIGYATLGAVLVERNPNAWFVKLFTPVGRMALTVYLLTSVICVTIFYSWGGGFFGKFDYFQLLGTVFAVWVVLVGFAHLWMSKFPMGPVERVWRTLAMGREAVNRAGSAPTTPTPGAPPPIMGGGGSLETPLNSDLGNGDEGSVLPDRRV